MRRRGRAGALCMLSLALAGAAGAQDFSGIEERGADETRELVLRPIEVWDERRTGEPQKVEAEGREFSVRLRSAESGEYPYARVGLLWHARAENMFMPVVLLGESVDILGAEIRAGAVRAPLEPARRFQFTPARSDDDESEPSWAVFSVPFSLLKEIAYAPRVHLIVRTDRGTINLGPDIVADESPDALRRNLRYLLAQMAERIDAINAERA